MIGVQSLDDLCSSRSKHCEIRHGEGIAAEKGTPHKWFCYIGNEIDVGTGYSLMFQLMIGADCQIRRLEIFHRSPVISGSIQSANVSADFDVI